MIITFLATLVIGYTLFVSDNKQKVAKQQSYYDDMQIKYKSAFRKYHGYKQHEINLAQDKQQLARIVKSLPSKTNTFQINSAITTAANQTGLKIVSLTSLPSEEHGFYTLTPINIKASSSYHQAARFISDIANLDQIIIVGDFSMQNQANNQPGLDVNVTLNLYQPSGSRNETK